MKKMRKQFAIAMVAIMLLSVLTVTLTCLPTIVSATPWTPVEWQDDGKLKNWVRDQNGNFVDDLIEAQTGKVDIIVDLNGCIGEPANSEIVKYLNTLGDVVYVGKYVSFIIVKGVEGDRCVDIANRPEVAMVELATTDKWLDDNFRASKVETSATYRPNTLQDAFGWPVVRNGSGINIAFLDTGANPTYDPYVTHGYDAINNVEINPGHEPGLDHASWMASWVFGPGRIAPQAGLVDIKVGDASGPDPAAEMRALEKVYEKQRDWGINVVVMMSGGSASLDGRETRQQLIDLLSGQGIVVVAATGGNTNDAPVTGPGAATRAIGVSAANIMNTVDRGDDVAPYVRGPRMDDGDMDQLDELKPEVIMPTGESGTQVSNSIATAMTSGLVALILESHLGLRNFDNKASGSVKDLLIRSAEPKGTADTTMKYPRPTPTWDQYWGFGEIDAFEAFRYLSDQEVTGRTDLTFMGFDGTSHPSSPWYYSHAVETQSERDGRNIEAGVPDRIFAQVYNDGPQDAHNVRVSFGFYPFTAGIPKFYDIGSVVTDIEGFSDEIVSIDDWTPPTLPAGEDHGCILVTIDYGLDSKFSDGSNFAQKNVQVQPASSPAVFAFRVENPLPTRAGIELKVMTEHKDWTIKLSETSFTMEPYECARTVQATVEPSARVKPGTEALLFVTAYATAMGQEKGVEIGGVALKALGPTPPPGKPDLVIKDIKLTKMDGYCYVDYLISNTGTVSASASTTYLYVDGKKVASDSTGVLAAGASRWDRFTYRTTGTHTYKVCADGPNAISESKCDK
jgi:CheY-like chemotaxis protein